MRPTKSAMKYPVGDEEEVEESNCWIGRLRQETVSRREGGVWGGISSNTLDSGPPSGRPLDFFNVF